MTRQHGLQRVLIRTAALRGNVRTIARCVRPSAVMAVVKASAYGHDSGLVARALHTERLWGFGVATTQEARTLRTVTKAPIMILSAVAEQEVATLGFRHLIYPGYSADLLLALNAIARRRGAVARVHCKIDAGTTRIGLLPGDVPRIAALLRRLHHVRVEGVYTHFAEAENSRQHTETQLAAFLRAADVLERALRPPRRFLRHAACTAAALTVPRSRLDIVRIGIGVYGLWPSPAVARWSGIAQGALQPALAWTTRVLQVKWVPAGTRIGYGGTFRARRRMCIGILPVGYADGYDRTLSNRGAVLLRGRRCRVLGRVCMNLTMIDCTRVPAARAGDTVTLLGRQGKAQITAEELACQAGTLHYELVSRIHPSIERTAV